MKMNKYLIKDVAIVKHDGISRSDIMISGERIEKISDSINPPNGCTEIDGSGLHAMPGLIDDQVHFREPGLTHKADIGSESRAAVAGGVTSFMEMPNTKPQAVTKKLLEEKYSRAAEVSPANYSFFMGTTNENWEEAVSIDPSKVCGIKVFMGSSTGNMLVDDPETLKKIFCNSPTLVAIHSETEEIIRKNEKEYFEKFGEDIPFSAHPEIRSREACIESTHKAIDIAEECKTRLHILHISTKEEAELFKKGHLKDKLITSEACVHHMYFDSSQYDKMGSLIKCNPAIKTAEDRDAILKAVLDDRIDIIATDHAPHSWDEKQNKYMSAPSGLPLVQHSLNILLDFYHRGLITLEQIAYKAAKAPAELFRIKDRGEISEGSYADIALVDLNKEWIVDKSNILYKCGWSPLEGKTIKGSIEKTFVSGNLAWSDGKVADTRGKRLEFDY
ncbi:MAG: dihydroorotase [Candidatus Kapaibacteriales bacterium]